MVNPPADTPAALAALDYDELERLHAAATPGPWRATTKMHPEAVRLRSEAATVSASDCRIYTSARDYECDRETWERQCADAEFIAALRNAFPALLAAARQGEETDYAIMEAIERTVKLCDQQERKRIPREAREVDYAGILAASKEAAAKRRAARAAAQPEEVSRA